MQYEIDDYIKNFKHKLLAIIEYKYCSHAKQKRRSLFKEEYSNMFNLDEKKFSNTANEWLTGRNLASFDNLLRICSFFDCDIEYFITKQESFSKNISSASEATGLDYATIDRFSKLPISEKHIIDAIFGGSINSIDIIKIIREMLYYSHPITKNRTHITLDKGLTARDKYYDELEHELNNDEVIDILSYKLTNEMRKIIETLSADEKLSSEINQDYQNKFFKKHKKILSDEDLPKLFIDDEGNVVLDLEQTIYDTEQKILNRLEKRDKKGRNFDYGIDGLHNYSDFSKLIKKHREEMTKEDYLKWLNNIDDETE